MPKTKKRFSYLTEAEAFDILEQIRNRAFKKCTSGKGLSPKKRNILRVAFHERNDVMFCENASEDKKIIYLGMRDAEDKFYKAFG